MHNNDMVTMKKKHLITACLLAALLASCVKEPVQPEIISTTYDKVKITEFNYPVANVNGGEISPAIGYEYLETVLYDNGQMESKTKTEGASVSYMSDDCTIDLSTGMVNIPVNATHEPQEYTITATVSIGGKSDTREYTIMQLPPEATYTYSGLAVEILSYNDIPSCGGTVAPIFKYVYNRRTTWTNGNIENETLDSGAVATFAINTEDVSIDPSTGVIYAAANTVYEEYEYEVTLTVSLADGQSVTSRCTVIRQLPEDDIIASETVQLPIQLEPHTCVYPLCYDFTTNVEQKKENIWSEVSYLPMKLLDPETGQAADQMKETSYQSVNRDGKMSEDMYQRLFSDTRFHSTESRARQNVQFFNIEYETVSARGTTLTFSGGELANVNTYLSGRKDTVIIAQPVYSSTVEYGLRPFYRCRPFYKQEDIAAIMYNNQVDAIPEYAPSNTILNDNTWKINGMGPQEFVDITHTLKASVNGSTVSLTLRQSNNTNVMEVPKYKVEFLEREITVHLSTELPLPEIEDYPPGSDPRWQKWQLTNWPDWYQPASYYSTPYSGWIDPMFTKTLHPDSNRTINIYAKSPRRFPLEAKIIFLSGATREMEYSEEQMVEPEAMTVTAEADIPTANGTKHVKHTYQWTDALYESHYHAFYLPYEEEATDVFEWTVTVEVTPDEDTFARKDNAEQSPRTNKVTWFNDTNYLEDCLPYRKAYTFQVRDSKSSIQEWMDSIKPFSVAMEYICQFFTSTWEEGNSNRLHKNDNDIFHYFFPNIIDGVNKNDYPDAKVIHNSENIKVK